MSPPNKLPSTLPMPLPVRSSLPATAPSLAPAKITIAPPLDSVQASPKLRPGQIVVIDAQPDAVKTFVALAATEAPADPAARAEMNRLRMSSALGAKPLPDPNRKLSEFEKNTIGYRDAHQPYREARTGDWSPVFSRQTGEVIAYDKSNSGYHERRTPDGAFVKSGETPIEGDLWYDPVNFATELLPGGAVATLGAGAVRTAGRVFVKEAVKETTEVGGKVLAKDLASGTSAAAKPAVKKIASTELTEEGAHVAFNLSKGAAHASTEKELAKLGASELAIISPQNAFAAELRELAHSPGFIDFAKANPKEARAIVELAAGQRPYTASGLISDTPIVKSMHQSYVKSGAHGYAATAKQALAEVVSARAPLGRTAGKDAAKNFTVIERGPKGDPTKHPAVELRLKPELDHNGAFYRDGFALDARGNFVDAVSQVPRPNGIQPSQLIVGGKPLGTLENVMSVATHGMSTGFEGATTEQAAKLAATEIRAARAAGRNIDVVVLDACNQRNARWLLGGSNSEAFAKALAKELSGEPPVTVLAASKGGPTFGSSQAKTWMKSGADRLYPQDLNPASYVPSTNGARPYVSPTAAKVGAGAAVALGGEAAVLYALTDDEPRYEPVR